MHIRLTLRSDWSGNLLINHMEWFSDGFQLWAGLPGQESGNGLVDVLYGAVNPSGRLPYTIGKQRSDSAADILYSSPDSIPQINYGEGLLIDYRWFDAKNITPRFEFG